MDVNTDESGVDLLQNPMEVHEETPGNSVRSKPPIRMVVRGTFQVSSTGIAWMYESQSKMHTCTHDGYLQRWTPTREQFQLDEELPIYALSQVSLRVLMSSRGSESGEKTSETLAPTNHSDSAHSPSPSGPHALARDFMNAVEDFVEDLAVTSIAYSSVLKTLLVAFQGGRAAVLVGNLEASLTDLKLHWLPLQGATVVAVNERKALLTIGLENGDVWLYSAHPGFKAQKQLSLSPWGITKRVTGAARRLEWTPDGRVLAVGYAARGLSTWSSAGCRLNCTISEVSVMNEEYQFQIGSAFFTPSNGNGASGSGAPHSRRTKSRDRSSANVMNSMNSSSQSVGSSTSATAATPSNPPSTSSTPRLSAASAQRDTKAPSSSSSATGSGGTSPKSAGGRSASRSGSSATLPGPHSSSPLPPLSHTPTPIVEGAFGGVNALSWGFGGYTLLISCGGISSAGTFDQYQFVKASVAANMNMSSSERIMLQGSDRVMLLMNRGRALGELSWNHLPLPTVYAQDSWPVRIASVSPDGTQLAVAGQRGFVIKSLAASGAWSLFGDRMEEQALRVVALAWFRTYLVIVAWCETAKAYQVMFFPRGQKLAFSSLAYRGNVPLGKTPTFLDCNDSYLVLFTQDSYFQYKITEAPATPRAPAAISLTLTHQLSVDVPFSATSVLVLPSSVVLTEMTNPKTTSMPPPSAPATPRQTSPREAKLMDTGTSAASKATPTEPKVKQEARVSRTMAKMLVLDSNGVLSLTNAERSFNAILSKGIEQFWMANSEASSGNDDLGNSLWAFGERGLEVWFPFFSQTVQASQQQNYLTRERSMEFDPEVCPIGFLREFGLIVGVCQGPTKAFSTPAPCFSYETKTQPFLHSVLKRMLERGEIQPAVDMAKRYASVSHFQHSLELLLHEALESQHHADKKRRKQREVLAASNGSINSLNASSSQLSKSLNEDFDDAASESAHSRRTSIDISSEPSGAPSMVPSGSSSQLHAPQASTPASSSKTLERLGTSSALLTPSSHSANATPVVHRRNRSSEKPKVLLRYVFEFLREFGVQMYTMIVVSCARKTDPALWRTLFHPRYTAGKPRALFEHCLSTGQLTVATSYLRVIQLIDGQGESRRAALQCLDLCLKLDNLELLRDLMRFLEPDGAQMLVSSTGELKLDESKPSPRNPSISVTPQYRPNALQDDAQMRKDVESHTTGGFSEQQEQFILDDTLGRYARKLLASQDLRSLVRFAKITRHDLQSWLAKERKRAAIIEDFPATLARLHSDFAIPRPTHFPIEHLHLDNWEHSLEDYSAIYYPNSDFLLKAAEEEEAMNGGWEADEVRSNGSGSGGSMSGGGSNSGGGFPPPLTYGTGSGFLAGHAHDLYDEASWNDTSVLTSFRDLEHLLRAMIASDCAGYALLLATVLFRVPIILSVLEKHPIFWRVYKPLLLAERQSQGYGELLVYLLSKIPGK